MNRRANTIEVLNLYGWTFLVFLAMTSALFYLGILQPLNAMPSSCYLYPEFDCEGIETTADSISIVMANRLPYPITIQSVEFTAGNITCAGVNVQINASPDETVRINTTQTCVVIEKGKVYTLTPEIIYVERGRTLPQVKRGRVIWR